MHVSPHIFREYDIRGNAETDLTDPVVRAIGQAFGTRLKRKGATTVSVGGDVRLSTERIRAALTEGLLSTGLDVLRLETVPTPMLYWSIHHFGIDGGVMVTGSHNPKEMNGLKLAEGDRTLYGGEIQEILNMILTGDFHRGNPPGQARDRKITDDYIQMLQSKIVLGPRKLKIVTDSGNGTGGFTSTTFLRGLGCEVIPLFEEPDGNFPNHHPDPQKRENLTALAAAVREHGADCGIAFDGDADRLGVVDERGEMVWGDILMALFWREIMPGYPGSEAIVEVKCSQALVDEILRLGGRPLFWKSGHSLIKAKMKEIGAVFAGELSGHFFFADEYYGFDDGFYAAGRLLRILSNSPQTLSEMLSSVPVYYSTAEIRIPCPDGEKFSVVDEIRRHALEDHEAITVDGVRILYHDGWGLVRASNTQPVIVARCEGKTPEVRDAIGQDVRARILAEGLSDFQWSL